MAEEKDAHPTVPDSPKLDGLVRLMNYMDAEQFIHFAQQVEKMLRDGRGYGKITMEFTDWHYRFITPQPHIEVPKAKPLQD